MTVCISLLRTEDGVHRAGLDAKRAADADLFVDHCHGFWFFLAVLRVQGQDLDSEQVCQRLDARFPARRALVDVRLARSYRFGVGATARKITLSALGLRQNGVNLINHGVGINFEFSGAQPSPSPNRLPSTVIDECCELFEPQSFASPVKPMKASAINPAVISPIGAPLK